MSRRKNVRLCNRIIIEAKSKLDKSYCPSTPDSVSPPCGWRNGFLNDNGCGPTVTALGLEFLCKLDELPKNISIQNIIQYLVESQLTDDKGDKLGWEVMSMKDSNNSTSSIDATATVVRVLAQIESNIQRFGIDENLVKAIKDAISSAQRWLKKKAESYHWGVHDGDAHRVFVMCNMLHVFDTMGKPIKKIQKKMIEELISNQNEDGGWPATFNENARSTIYHTAKVLNYLEGIKNKNDKTEKSITRGVKYLKDQIKNLKKHMPDKCYEEEEVLGCNGKTKFFYHDQFSEWLNHICHSTKWSDRDFYDVLKIFLTTHVVDKKRKMFFYQTENSNRDKKDQAWILLPSAMQCIDNMQYMGNHFRGIIKRTWGMVGLGFVTLIVYMVLTINQLGSDALTPKNILVGIIPSVLLPFIINLFSSYVYDRWS